MLREFLDVDGNAWRVWDINPDSADLTTKLRGRRASLRVPAGWLCFESRTERRRLTPIPEGWDTCDVETLRGFCARATLTPVRPTDSGPDVHRETGHS